MTDLGLPLPGTQGTWVCGCAGKEVILFSLLTFFMTHHLVHTLPHPLHAGQMSLLRVSPVLCICEEGTDVRLLVSINNSWPPSKRQTSVITSLPLLLALLVPTFGIIIHISLVAVLTANPVSCGLNESLWVYGSLLLCMSVPSNPTCSGSKVLIPSQHVLHCLGDEGRSVPSTHSVVPTGSSHAWSPYSLHSPLQASSPVQLPPPLWPLPFQAPSNSSSTLTHQS